MNPRHMMVVLLLCGCATEDRDPVADDGIVVDDDGGDADDASSEDGVETESTPGGPYAQCASDAECALIVDDEGREAPVTECLQGTCVYACGNGWEYTCPAFVTGAECATSISRCVIAKLPPEVPCDEACADLRGEDGWFECMDACRTGANPINHEQCPAGLFEGPGGGCFWGDR